MNINIALTWILPVTFDSSLPDENNALLVGLFFSYCIVVPNVENARFCPSIKNL